MNILLLHFNSIKSHKIIEILKKLNCNVYDYDPYINYLTDKKIKLYKKCDALIISGSNPKYDTTEIPELDNKSSFYMRIKRVIDLFTHKKILGICYGSQILYKYFGGDCMYYKDIYGHTIGEHFKKILIKNTREPIFKNVQKHHVFNFYRNILLDPTNKPNNIKIISHDITNIKLNKNISGFKINNKIYGLIFHPESSFTSGYNILYNFINL